MHGGKTCKANVVAACTTCNLRKGNMTAQEFLMSERWAIIVRGRKAYPIAPPPHPDGGSDA